MRLSPLRFVVWLAVGFSVGALVGAVTGLIGSPPTVQVAVGPVVPLKAAAR